jgi:AcrR family transcriptional regulator
MTTKTRAKQPEVVRRRLLDSASTIVAGSGLAALSIQAVAVAAGVTKGAVFHHFPSKQSLLEAMFLDMLEQLDRAIDAWLDPDETAYGRFTRAYVELVFAEAGNAADRVCAALSASMVADPDLNRLWSEWLRERLRRHSSTDSDSALTMVRLAADGLWLTRVNNLVDEPALKELLTDVTRRQRAWLLTDCPVQNAERNRSS